MLNNNRKTLAAVYKDFFATHYARKGKLVRVTRRGREIRTTAKRQRRGCNGTMTTALDLRRREVALNNRLQLAQ